MKSTNDDQPPSDLPEDPDRMANEQSRPTGSSHQAARSYECLFCKRGFSNAQALGGHMNIHRKDKAKLKQLAASSNPNPNTEPQFRFNQPVEVTRLPSLYYSPNVSNIIPASSQTQSVPSMGASEIDNPETRKLFTGFSVNQHHEERVHFEENDEEKAGDGRHPGDEVDLELRLGPEGPQGSSPSSKGTTKKFF